MCVLVLAQHEARITAEHVKKMYGVNRDGAGIAWRENGKVHWRKGLNEQEMTDLCLTVPQPYVGHFRIASCGGVLPELTHPFPINKQATIALKGSTPGYVLFHNGHLTRWRDFQIQLAVGKGLEVPPGAWSDTRLMAWIASYCGLNILPAFDEKLIAFGLDNLEIYGQGWTKVDGLFVSNRGWEHHTNYSGRQTSTICYFGTCKEPRHGNTSYCEQHQNGIQRGYAPVQNRDGASEVSSSPSTFRGGNLMAGGGKADEKGVQGVPQQLGGVTAASKEGSGVEEGSQAAATPDSPLTRRLGVWSRRIAPKKVTPPAQTEGDDEDYFPVQWMH